MKKLSVFIPILLTIVVVFSIVPSVFAATVVELKYDDGSTANGYAQVPGYYLAVKFSLPFGWDEAKLITARYYIQGLDAPTDFNVYIFMSDGSTRLLGPLTVTATALHSWLDVDLSSYDIVVTGDFYVAIEFITSVPAPAIGIDFSDPDGRSYENNPNIWYPYAHDIMIRAVVEPYSTPVGGIFYSANKVGIITPYIALVGLIGAVSTIFAIRRWRKG